MCHAVTVANIKRVVPQLSSLSFISLRGSVPLPTIIKSTNRPVWCHIPCCKMDYSQMQHKQSLIHGLDMVSGNAHPEQKSTPYRRFSKGNHLVPVSNRSKHGILP